MVAKICIILIFVGVVVGVGVYARQHTKNVDGFVLGGRNVGPWLSAFAFGTSYFSAVIFVGYAGQFGWGMVEPAKVILTIFFLASAMPFLVRCWHGGCLVRVRVRSRSA